jgi:hypothetical protein
MPKKAKPAPARKRAAAPLTIIDAMSDPNVWGPWFKNRKSWSAWFAFLSVMFALPLDADELATFKQCTGRTAPRAQGHTEATLIIGRRGGKSLIMALIAAYLACFRDWSPYLVPGERGVVTIIAADKRQAQSIFRYLKALLSIPLLGNLIERETAEVLELANRVSIEVMTASFRTIRGRTVVAALCDELAFWRTDEESANPDADIIEALKPSMATITGAVMIKASSPYARRGVLWEDHRKHFGKDDSDLLVWQAPTRVMNPSVPQSFIDDETEADPANASAEFGAQFRTDLEAFVSREAVEAVTVQGRIELPPYEGGKFVAWCDPSGGSSDSMTLAIAHREADIAVLDAVREFKPPFSPEAVVAEIAELLKLYGIKMVYGDRYAGLWPRERFDVHGIGYRVSEDSASEVYQAFLPILNSGRCELLDLKKMRNQIISLERKVSRSGRDSISHPPGQHDDIAAAVSGALVKAANRSGIAFNVPKAITKPPPVDPKPPTVNDLLNAAWDKQQRELDRPYDEWMN